MPGIALDRPGYRVAAWVGIAALAAGLVFEAAQADGRGVLLFAIFGVGALGRDRVGGPP